MIIRPEKHFFSSLTDGNIAFKCTYNDMGYKDICSNEIYEYNKKAGRIWCNDKNSKCRDFIGRELSASEFPCYESALFLYWLFGGGVRRGEKTDGTSIKIANAHQNKLAFLTTRNPGDTEKDRYIFGFLHIKNIANRKDPTDSRKEINESHFVIGEPEKSLQFNSKVKIPFWNHYRNYTNPGSIQWGSGLFRYLTDKSVSAILIDLKEEYDKIEDSEAISIINSQLSRYQNKSFH